MATIFFEFKVLCLIALIPLGSFEFICPGAIYPPQGLTYGYIESNISGRASQNYAKLRIKVFFDSSIHGKPYKEMVQKAADFWSNALSVKPVSGPIFKSRDCSSVLDYVYIDSRESNVKEKHCLGSCASVTKCHNFEIPNEHLDGCKSCQEDGKECKKHINERGIGIENADFVLYAFAMDIERCKSGQVLASAAPCELDPIRDRPLFAIANICPKAAATTSKNDMLMVLKHELMHALGFGFFMYFRDSNGTALWPRNENGEPNMNKDVQPERVLKTIERDWNVRGGVIKTNRTFLVTPKVVIEAQAHFGCLDLEGAELEDYGRKGTQYGHLEARVFYDDAMKGNADTGKGLFSRIDFAVLEDSGWYQVDYSQAEDMEFGRNLGCDFCMKSCKFWMDKKRKEGKCVEPYCETPDLGYFRGITCIGPKKLLSGCPLTKLSLGDVQQLLDPNSTDPFSYQLLKYQNFDQIYGVYDSEVPQWGSFDKVADCCPVPGQSLDVTVQVGNVECGIGPNQPWNPNPWNPNPWNPVPWNPNRWNRNPWNPNPWNPNPWNPDPWNPNPWNPNPWKPSPWNPNPGNPNPWNPNPWNPNPGNPDPAWNPNHPPNTNPSWTSWEQSPKASPNPSKTPNPTSKPWEPTPTSSPNPAEAQYDEDERNQSSYLCSSDTLVFLVPFIVILLRRATFSNSFL